MDLRVTFLRKLCSEAKGGICWSPTFGDTWPYANVLRDFLLRLERGDAHAWNDLMELRAIDKNLAAFMRDFLDYAWPDLDKGVLVCLQSSLAAVDRGEFLDLDEFAAESVSGWRIRNAMYALLETADCGMDEIHPADLDFFLNLLQPDAPVCDAKPARARKSKSRIMYVERKAGRLTGEARIGRVTFSKSGKSLYFRGKRFETQDGRGFKSNYFEVETGEDYWISGPRRDGKDRLYGERQPIEIDEDVREEYWTAIRKRPDLIDQTAV
jgi:hypothetical protein